VRCDQFGAQACLQREHLRLRERSLKQSHTSRITFDADNVTFTVKGPDSAAVVDEVFREEILLAALMGIRPRSNSNRSGSR
jgi:hypothetical protein